MEIKHSIFRRGKKSSNSTGRLENKWTMRLIYLDADGQKRSTTKQYRTKVDALDDLDRLKSDIKKTAGQIKKGERMSFADLAEHAKGSFYGKAEIVEGRKIEGVRSYQSTNAAIRTLTEYFGQKRITDISTSDLRAYKSWRVKQGNRQGTAAEQPAKERKPIKLSTINRELTVLQKMMRHAHREGWIIRDIFAGAKVIDKDAETARTRTLRDAEEVLLLAACEPCAKPVTFQRNTRGLGKKKSVTQMIETGNPYLKAIILLALDSGLRRGEILKLSWSDIRFDIGVIQILGTHTKTQQPRAIPLTERTQEELTNLPSYEGDGRVFPISDFKNSFQTACRIAGIEGLTFHDLRRTCITRWSKNGIPLAIAGKLAGHAKLSTTQKHYVSTDDLSIIQDVKAKSDAANIQRLESQYVN